jgi:hypothetical protein
MWHPYGNLTRNWSQRLTAIVPRMLATILDRKIVRWNGCASSSLSHGEPHLCSALVCTELRIRLSNDFRRQRSFGNVCPHTLLKDDSEAEQFGASFGRTDAARDRDTPEMCKVRDTVATNAFAPFLVRNPIRTSRN